MTASANRIEVPKKISSKKDGYEVMADMCCGLEELMKVKTADSPLCGILYLEFNTEAELDEWVATFKTMTNLFWHEKMKQKDDLHFLCCSPHDKRTLLDFFFAETEADVKTIAKMRFPGMEFKD